MTEPDGPDFVLGMAEELRPSPGMGESRTATGYVGHAVTPENLRAGEHASRAICGAMTTVSDPTRYEPRSGMAYGHCFTCSQRVTAAR